MWKLRSRNIETFQTLRMRVTLPVEALAQIARKSRAGNPRHDP